MSDKQRIRLVMNVRDDADVLGRCIDSVLPVISSYLIIDTGSIDNTKEVVKEKLGHLPGELLETEWVSHAHNRTLLLRVANDSDVGDSDFSLMMDSDMTLEIPDGNVPELTYDMYLIDIYDRGSIYPLPLLTNRKQEWVYGGPAHAYLSAVNANATVGKTRQWGWKLIDHGGSDNTRPGKLEKDLANLQLAVAQNPTDARSWYYLAQTYRDLEMWQEAVAAYRFRISLGGWQEEIYSAMLNAGIILTRKFGTADGLQVLLDTWIHRPTRAEPLRAIAEIATIIADQIPFPEDDVLFINESAYTNKSPLPVRPLINEGPGFHKLRKRNGSLKKLTPKDVSAIIVTRGNVDLEPIVDSLPYDDIVVWDNSDPTIPDYKVFGRYAALTLAKNSVIYFQDDDIIFREHDKLLIEYEPGKIVSNMDQAWIEGAGYGDFLGMVGAGSLCDIDLPDRVFGEYFKHYEWDKDMLYECDFCFGTLAPFKRVDLGYEVRPFADDQDRLYQQSWQMEKKWAMINRCRALLTPPV